MNTITLDPPRRITIVVPADTHEALTDLARKHRRSMTQELLTILELALKEGKS
jgi:hypothetical protein